MKKVKPVQAIDSVLILWGLFFALGPVFSPNISIEMKIFFWVSSLANFFYLVYVIRFRISWNKNIDRENDVLKQIETESPAKDNLENNLYFEVKQKVLENWIESELKAQYPEAKILKNIYCPKPDGSTSEIDIVMICKDGIFLFEAKNFSARISGNWSSDKLIATYENGKQIEILNPVIQNSYHFQHLRKLLGINPTQHAIKNIVVLGDSVKFDREEIKKTIPGYAHVCQFKGIIKAVENKRLISKDVFKESQVQSLFDTISNELSYSPERKAKHIQNIRDLETQGKE